MLRWQLTPPPPPPDMEEPPHPGVDPRQVAYRHAYAAASGRPIGPQHSVWPARTLDQQMCSERPPEP